MKNETFIHLLGSNTDILLLDIREAEELADAPTIMGAVHMPMGKVFTEAGEGNLPKGKHIVVFCRTGKRAGIVEKELRASGYHVDGLEGGLNEHLSTSKSL